MGREGLLITKGGSSRRALGALGRAAATESISVRLDTDDLRGKVRRGLRWKLLNVVLGQGSEALISILLAHILLPRDFGLAGLAIVFSGLALGFSDIGLGAAIIQRKTLTDEDCSTVFWVTVMAGAVLTVLGVALSPLVADFFSNPRVMPLFAVLSTSFLLVSLGQTQRAILTREMSFRSLELRNIAATVTGAVAALALALAGFGPWALIGQVVVTAGASTAMLWTVSPWRPQLTFDRDGFRTLGSFGLKTLLSRLLIWVNLNGDNLLVGRFIGSTALGIYAVAYNVMVLPASNITSPLRDVLYSAFARLQHDTSRLGEVWLRVNNVSGSVLVPAFLGLAAVAPDFVPAVLGPHWHAAIPVLQMLSLGAAFGCLQSFNGQVYQALGEPGLFLRFMCFVSVVTFGAFVVGLHWGVVGVAASYAVARAIALVSNSIQMSRLMGLSLRRMLGSYVEIFARAGAMGAAVFATRSVLVDLGLPSGARLAVLIVGGALVYLALTMLVAPRLVRDARDGLLHRSLGQVRTSSDEEMLRASDPAPTVWKRADWRFLLPDPDPGPVYLAPECSGESAALEALGFEIAREPGDAAIAIVDGCHCDLAELERVLPPGAIVRIAVTASRSNGNWNITKQLEDRGWDVLSRIWTPGGIERAAAYVDVDDRTALAYWWRAYPRGDARKRVVGPAGLALARAGSGRMLCREGFVLARTPT